jgi:flavin reductase (DIM6/NTAB) family NADH-FMN oxidoreductase RutF
VTANSVSSVSLDPPLVLWSQAVKTQSHPVFFKAERFAVNILAEDQIELSNRFAKSSQEKFAGLDVDIGSDGVPLLRGCSARLQCRVVSRVPGGDHTIYVGEVHAGTLDQVAPHRDHAERLLAAAPWAKSFSFEDCGHMLKLEAPVTFNSIVR